MAAIVFPRTEALLDRVLGGRFVVQVVALYAVTRVLTGVMLAVVSGSQAPSAMTDNQTVGYWGFTTLWDGQWYARIASDGYPDTLPRDTSGQVMQNAWAFYPLFPMLSRAVMAVTGLPFAVVGSTLALLFGFGAAVLLAQLMRESIGRVGALLVLSLYAVFPSSPVLQVAYTESLAMLLICGYLLVLRRERWLVATALAVLVGVSRPIAVPLAIVSAVALWLRWRRRATEPVARGERFRMLAALAGCVVAGLLWPALVWMGTGEPGGYVATMGAWSATGEVRFVQPWLDTPRWYLGEWGPWLVLAVVVGIVAGMAGPWAVRLGPVVRVWPVAYAAYSMAVQGPGTSTPRYLLPMFPYLAVLLGLASRGQRPRWVPTGIRWLWLAPVFLWWQWEWIAALWHFTPPSDWAP
ncbi:MAG: hypothetical protein CSA84_03445 [Actinomycetales bacterium]|nr:MAG: hypothetical protein CSA84_03445 [Actinomycetales bacterium]